MPRFTGTKRRKVLKLPLVLLLMHQPDWPNCSSSQARYLLPKTVINYPIFPHHEIAIASGHLMFNTSINFPACVLFSWRLNRRRISTVSNCDIQPAVSHQPSPRLLQRTVQCITQRIKAKTIKSKVIRVIKVRNAGPIQRLSHHKCTQMKWSLTAAGLDMWRVFIAPGFL